MTRPHQLSERLWQKNLLELASFLAEEALSPDVFDRFLQMLARSFPGQSAILDYGPDQQRTEFAGWGFDAAAKRAYSEHFHAVNPFTYSILNHRLYNHTFVGSRWVDQQMFSRTEFYNDWLRPRGERYVVVLSIGFDDGSRTGFPVYRGEAEGGDFSFEDARRLDALRPFLKNTLLLRRWFRKFPTGELSPALIASAKRQLQEANEARLTLSAPAFVTEDCRTRVASPSETSRLIFLRRYGVSPREAEVASLLCEGLSYVEIAGALGISYHTVNAHVKSLLRKLNVSSIRLLPRLLRDEPSMP